MPSNQTLNVASVAAIGTVTMATALYLSRKTERPLESPTPTKPTVYGFQPITPYADSSPACLKLATYLKICKVDFDYKYFPDHEMKDAPKAKVPWMYWEKLNQGKRMGDSTLIINALMKLDPNIFDIDSHLSDEQHAIGVALKSMLEESTYWTGVINVRWLAEQFHETTVPTYFGKMPVPSLIKPFIIKKIRSKVIRDAKGQGTLQLNEAERKEKFDMELKAISDYLGDKKYIMGNKVSSFDATVFAWLAILVQGAWKHDVCDSVRECKKLMDYVERIRHEFWTE